MADSVELLNKPKKEINYQFKVMYVIGILDVLLTHAHAELYNFWSETIHAAGYTIALFVFVSGYFYNTKSESNVFAYILKKAKRLLLPLYLWNTFYALLSLAFAKIGMNLGGPVNLYTLTLAPMTSFHLLNFNDPAWFIIPLFVTEIYHILVRKLLVNLSDKIKDFSLLIFHFIVGFAGVALAMHEKNTGWWLFLTRFMYFIPFYSLGYVYKKYLEEKDRLSSFWYFSIIIAIDILIILFNGHASMYSIVIMDEEYFENPFLPFLVGILGVAFALRASRILNTVIGKSKYLNILADNTFPIMMNHIFGFFVLKCIFFAATKVLPMLPEFPVEEFKNNLFYMYLPRGRGFPLLYVFFGMIIPIFMQKIVVSVKKLILKRGK